MRRLGLALAVIVPLAACAADPNYLTGAAGTSGATAGSGGGGAAGGAGTAGGTGSYTPPVLKLSHPNPIVSRPAQGSQVFSSPANGSQAVNGQYHTGGWSATAPTAASC